LPGSFLARLCADLVAVIGVFVRPDDAPDVEYAEFRMTSESQRRQLDARVDRGRPAVDLARDRARPQRVHADLVDAAELTRLQFRRERRRNEDLGFLVG